MIKDLAEKQRTERQNNALHLYFREVAEELNNAGFEQTITFSKAEVPWNEWSVKTLFQKLAKAQFGKQHTSQLTTRQLTEVYDTFNRLIAETGIEIQFPHLESLEDA